MAKQPSEQITEASVEALTKSGQAAEKVMKDSADALSESVTASRAATGPSFGPKKVAVMARAGW